MGLWSMLGRRVYYTFSKPFSNHVRTPPSGREINDMPYPQSYMHTEYTRVWKPGDPTEAPPPTPKTRGKKLKETFTEPKPAGPYEGQEIQLNATTRIRITHVNDDGVADKWETL